MFSMRKTKQLEENRKYTEVYTLIGKLHLSCTELVNHGNKTNKKEPEGSPQNMAEYMRDILNYYTHAYNVKDHEKVMATLCSCKLMMDQLNLLYSEDLLKRQQFNLILFNREQNKLIVTAQNERVYVVAKALLGIALLAIGISILASVSALPLFNIGIPFVATLLATHFIATIAVGSGLGIGTTGLGYLLAFKALFKSPYLVLNHFNKSLQPLSTKFERGIPARKIAQPVPKHKEEVVDINALDTQALLLNPRFIQ